MYTLNCKGTLLSLETPIIMGIINVNNQSFFEGSRKTTKSQVLQTAAQMLEEGAAILDLGGQSTHPRSPEFSSEEEGERVIPVIEALIREFPEAILSVDTYYSEVARRAVEAGAKMVNDISAGMLDPKMLETVGRLNVPYVAMHMRGSPSSMQQSTQYVDLVGEVIAYFAQRVDKCHQAGIKDVIIDPGFGFAKTQAQNYQLLARLQELTLLGRPVMVGVSRKSMIYRALGVTAAEALNGSTVLQAFSLQNSADILRVHDVKEAMQTIQLLSLLKQV